MPLRPSICTSDIDPFDRQASFRGDGKSPGAPQKPCSKAVTPTPPKRRNSTLWSETLDVHQKGTFSTKEIKRQEVRISTRAQQSLRGPEDGVGQQIKLEIQTAESHTRLPD